ncbi:MAG: putative integral membrane protein (TIGR00697 family) [Alteromonas naphthalenivorans]|jgi:uncharacterized integral membrane protein (TIGR00697 family)
MWNEILFTAQSILISIFAIGSILLGQGCLYAFTAVCWIFGNFYVLKEVSILGLNVITTDSFAIGANMGIMLIQEYYGKKAAERSIFVGVYMSLFFLAISQLLVMYTPNVHDTCHLHFAFLIARMPRIVIGSIFVALFTMFLNLKLFDIFTKKLGQGSFYLASISALMIAQFIDVVLFVFIALWGNVTSITDIILFSYLIKCISIMIVVPCVSLCKKFIPSGSSSF